MSRVCELTGKGRQVGNNVSHANNKTKRTFLPNLQNVTLMSESLEKSIKLKVSTHGLRSVEHVGGLDNWLAKTSEDKLSPRAAKLKREIAKKAEGRGLKALPLVGDEDARPHRRAFSCVWSRSSATSSVRAMKRWPSSVTSQKRQPPPGFGLIAIPS